MKFKFQQGGSFVPPFAVYQPFAKPTQGNVESSKTEDDKDDKDDLGIELKDVLGLIKDMEGLDGDEAAASTELNRLFRSIEYKITNRNNSLFGDTGSIATDYLKIVRLIDSMKGHANDYIKARDTAIANNSLSEVAIDSKGRLMVATNEGFDWITPEEYYENKEDYQLITNGELLEYRKHGVGGLAFNSQAIYTVASGMSSAQITELLQNAINNLGTTKDNSYVNGYVGVTAGELMNGLEAYLKAVENNKGEYTSVQDLYKISALTEHQAEQAQLAIQYLYRVLPNNARSFLKLHSGKGTDLGALELIQYFIGSKSNKTETFSQELVGGPTKELAKIDTDSNESDESKAKHSFVTNVQAGFGAHLGVFELNPESDVIMRTDMDVYEAVLGLDGKYIGKTSMINMLKQSGLISISKLNNVYFGNQLINQSKLEDMLYNGGAFARIEMPITADGKPNFKLFELYKEFENELKIGKTAAQLLKSEKYKNLNDIVNATNGSKRKQHFKPFLAFDVATTKSLVGINDDNKFVADKESSPETYKALIKYLSEAHPENAEKYSGLDTYDLIGELFTFGSYDHLYTGTLYIELDPNKHAAITGSGQNIPIQDTSYEEENQIHLANYNFDTPGASALNQ